MPSTRGRLRVAAMACYESRGMVLNAVAATHAPRTQDYLKWGYYIAFHSYTFRIFMHNEFNPINNLDCKPFCDGEEVLRFYDMGDVDVAADFGVLIGFAVFFQLCFAVVLYYFHTGRR